MLYNASVVLLSDHKYPEAVNGAFIDETSRQILRCSWFPDALVNGFPQYQDFLLARLTPSDTLLVVVDNTAAATLYAQDRIFPSWLQNGKMPFVWWTVAAPVPV